MLLLRLRRGAPARATLSTPHGKIGMQVGTSRPASPLGPPAKNSLVHLQAPAILMLLFYLELLAYSFHRFLLYIFLLLILDLIINLFLKCQLECFVKKFLSN